MKNSVPDVVENLNLGQGQSPWVGPSPLVDVSDADLDEGASAEGAFAVTRSQALGGVQQRSDAVLELYEEAKQDREGFWANQAEHLDWFQSWNRVLEWNPPYAKWYLGGKLNACYNCLDRHVKTPLRAKTALLWEGENGEERAFSYQDLFDEVCQFSAALKSIGVSKGDRVAIYLPLIPEALIAMLSCARIGAIHTVVFAGFSASALRDRIIDSEATFVITADGSYRKGKTLSLKEAVDSAVENTSVKQVVVVKRIGLNIAMIPGRDLWYSDLMGKHLPSCPPEWMDAEDPLFFLYTSGTTGKPKGIIHSTGGYLVGASVSMKWVFDLQPSDVYWCTADIGWITGHSYVTYGPLCNGATQVIYEGAFDFPDKARIWKMIEKYQVSILYTAPTAIRTFMKWGDEWLCHADLRSLRLLGSVGEPINPEVWSWYHMTVGRGQCPIVDTWWQTETGSIMISAIPGKTLLKPGSAHKPLPGIDAEIVNEHGSLVDEGYLVLTSPWPSMLRGIYGDEKRLHDTYWSKFPCYLTGDGARKDEDGDFWISGRSDDVINVSGHRFGTAEIESALVDHPVVAEAAAVPIPHLIKGQGIVAFVTLKDAARLDDPLLPDLLNQHVVKQIGAIARLEYTLIVPDLPKTRSGKIMRRLLKDIVIDAPLSDTTTLSDPLVVELIQQKWRSTRRTGRG